MSNDGVLDWLFTIVMSPTALIFCGFAHFDYGDCLLNSGHVFLNALGVYPKVE